MGDDTRKRAESNVSAMGKARSALYWVKQTLGAFLHPCRPDPAGVDISIVSEPDRLAV